MIRVVRYSAHRVALVAALGIVTVSSTALADSGASMTSVEIRASNDKGPSDAELTRGRLASKLKKGPFRSWTNFKVMAKHAKKLAVLKAQAMSLKTGGKLTVLLKARMQSKGKKDRLRLSVQIDKKSGKRHLDTTVEIDAGDYFLVGGEKLPDGATYILAISLN